MLRVRRAYITLQLQRRTKMVLARFGTAILLGALVTGTLLFIMQYLIATGHSALSDSEKFHFLDFVRVDREETLERKERKPDKPPPPESPPPDLPQPQQDSIDPNVETIAISAIPAGGDISIDGFGLAISDGDYLPIVKVAPIYPRRALSRGIEGYVIVEFTVTAAGTVKNPVIIESTSSVFERAALNAALKFKYKPRVVDGEPIEVKGVRNKITFLLES